MENFSYNLIFFLILIGGFLIRVIPQLSFKIESPDSYYHLTAARQIWKEKKIPSKLESFLFEGTYTYPPILHVLLAPIIRFKKITLGRMVSPIFDMLIGVLVFYVATDFFGEEIGLISFLIYVITPINVIESIKLTPRTIGQFFLTLFMFSVFYVDSNPFQLLLLIPIISTAIVLLSHKMATQSLAMLVIFVSVVYLLVDYNYSIFLMCGLILGVLFTIAVSKGFYLKIFRGHKAILSYHFKHGDFRKGKKQFLSPVQIVQRWPWIILVPFAMIFLNFEEFFALKNLNFLFIWGVFFVALTILWRFGSGFRYLVFGIPPTCIFFAYIIWSEFSQIGLVFLILAAGLSIARIAYYLKKNRKKPLITKELENCFNYLVSAPTKSVACVPASLNYQTAFFTEKKVLSGEASPEQFKEKRDYYSKFFNDDKTLLNLIKEFQTNTFLVASASVIGQEFEKIVMKSNLVTSTTLHDEGSYKILSIVER